MAKAKKEMREHEPSTAEEVGTEKKQAEDRSDREVSMSDGTADPANEAAEVEEPVDELEALQLQVADLEGDKLRALADLDNYRKAMIRRFQDVTEMANDRLLRELLDVTDNFERALAHTDSEASSNEEDLAAFRDGTELIYNQMMAFLSRYRVTPIEPVGHPFDPKFHEAMMQVASDEYDEGTVANEISKGYLIGDRVLRHARVAVSSGPTTEDAVEN